MTTTCGCNEGVEWMGNYAYLASNEFQHLHQQSANAPYQSCTCTVCIMSPDIPPPLHLYPASSSAAHSRHAVTAHYTSPSQQQVGGGARGACTLVRCFFVSARWRALVLQRPLGGVGAAVLAAVRRRAGRLMVVVAGVDDVLIVIQSGTFDRIRILF